MRLWIGTALCLIRLCLPAALWAEDAHDLLRRADRFADAGNWIQAKDLYARAELEFRTNGDLRNEMYAKFGRMHRDVEAGAYTRSLQELKSDLARPIVQNDPLLEIRALSLKGTIDLNLDTAAAKDDFTQILEIAKSVGDAKWQNRAQGELGVIAGINGDLGRAAVALFGALKKAEALHDLLAQLNFSVWLANGMAVNGMADRALKILDNAEMAAKDNANSGLPMQLYIARIRALINLPEGPKRDDGIAEAQRLIQKALVLAKRDNILGAQAELLNQAGLIAQRKTDLASAATYFTETAEVAKRAGLPRMRATALYDLCEVYRKQSKFSKAEAAINAAIVQDNKAQDAMDLPVYLGEKAEVEAALHRARLADDLYIQATALIDAMLAKALSSRVKSEMIAARGNVYLGYFRLALLTLHQPAKAFGILEQARGRALADSLISRSSQPDSKASSAEIKIAQIQTELRRTSNTAADTKRLTAKLDDAYNALIPVEYERDRAEVVQMSTPASLPAIQKALLPGEALIEYVLDNEKNSYAFEITSGQVLVHTLSSREEIEKRAQEYVKAVRSKQDSSQFAKALFASVVAPSVTTHPTSVIIIPDGALHLVPFASLRDEKDQYWMKSVQIASAPSATIFLRLRSAHQASEPTRPFLGVAFSPAPGSEPVTTASNSRVSSFGDHKLDLKPLPYAQQEVAAAADVFGKGSVLLTGDQASETALKAEPLNEFRIIHLAAHGVSDQMEPDRAGLVLAPGSGSEDGFWQSREIRRSHLSADLVTLSACETGTGRLQGEEGVMNLARSFLVAGAKSVVASLWDADDRSTATLMAHFYKHIAGGERVSDSLRKAQIEMLAEFGEDVKPYFWAGFTVIGDGTRKITSQTRSSELGTAHSDLQQN